MYLAGIECFLQPSTTRQNSTHGDQGQNYNAADKMCCAMAMTFIYLQQFGGLLSEDNISIYRKKFLPPFLFESFD